MPRLSNRKEGLMSWITLWEDVTADSHAVSVHITLSLHHSLHAGGTMGELSREKQ